MSQWTDPERARTARLRDRASRTVAVVSATATAGTVAATLGLASALGTPSPEVPSSTSAGGTTTSTTPGPSTPVESGGPTDASRDLALEGPDRTPTATASRRTSRPAQPRTSGS